MTSFPHKVKGFFTGSGVERKEYAPVQLDEAVESRVSFSARSTRGWYTDTTEPNVDVEAEASTGLLNHETNGPVETDEKVGWKEEGKKGIGYFTPSKIFGTIVLLAFVYGAYKLVAWAFYEPPVVLEGLPEFGTSLGCHTAPYFYNNTQTLILNAPMHPHRFDHGIDFQGGGVGTVTLTSTSIDSPNVRYEVTIRSNDNNLAQRSIIKLPVQDEAGHMFNSMATIFTPYPPEENPSSCVRYDVKIIIPPSLKKLHIGSHTFSHVKFDKNAKIELEELLVTLFTLHENMIQTSTAVKADRMSLELTRGWLTGDVSIVDETRLMTQRGDGVLHVDVYPEPPRDKKDPELVTLDMATGAGRTKVFVHSNKGAKRPISATHISSQNGPMNVSYKGAGISGLVGLEAKEADGEGLKRLDATDLREGEEWNYYVGRKDGKDRISVNTRGWVGLYF